MCLSRTPSGSGQEVGWVGVPCGSGSAKDTGLNVGSHDVTCDVEVDADEFALPTGKHRSWSVPSLSPSPIPAGKRRGAGRAHSGVEGETPQTQSPPGQPVGRNYHLQAGMTRGLTATQ